MQEIHEIKMLEMLKKKLSEESSTLLLAVVAVIWHHANERESMKTSQVRSHQICG